MDLHSFIFSGVFLLAVATIAVTLFRHIGLGSVLGLLVAGIAVGPYSPGPTITEDVEAVRHFTELGVVMLLFIIGLEMQPARLWSMRREVFGLGSMQILLSGAVIALYSLLFARSWQTAILIGLTFALSSTAFVMQILHERGEMNTPQGRNAFAILLMQDMAIVPLLALVPILSHEGRLSDSVPVSEQVLIVVAMLGLVFIFGRWLMPRALDRIARQGNREGFFMMVMLSLFLSAAAMEKAGLSMALGAFLMGMLLSSSRYSYQVEAVVEPFKGLLMSLFFVAVGMSIDLNALAMQPLTFFQHVVAILLIKAVVLFLLARAFRIERVVAMRIALMLSQGGEFGFVLFGAANALHVIDQNTFVIAIGVISVSMVLTPLLVKLSDRLAVRMSDAAPAPDVETMKKAVESAKGHVIVAGYGRTGQIICSLLERADVPYIAFDINPDRVATGRADGRPVFFGDVGEEVLMEAAHAHRASLVVVTIDRDSVAFRTVAHIRHHFPTVPVVARTRDIHNRDRFLKLGVHHAVPEEVEFSMLLGKRALCIAGVSDSRVKQIMEALRSDDYAELRPVSDDAGGS